MRSDPEIKSQKLLGEYLVLAFFLSWGLWAPVVLMFADVAQPPLWAVLLVFSAFVDQPTQRLQLPGDLVGSQMCVPCSVAGCHGEQSSGLWRFFLGHRRFSG